MVLSLTLTLKLTLTLILAQPETNTNTNPIQLFYAFFEHSPLIFSLVNK